jgi:hypothetical protein
MANSKSKVAAPKLSAAQWRSAKKLPIGADFVLVKIGNAIEAQVKPADQAAVLVYKAGVALRSPGISRGSVFRGSAPQKVFAYSVAPGDAGMLVREAQDGTKQLGKIGADGRFRVSRKTA